MPFGSCTPEQQFILFDYFIIEISSYLSSELIQIEWNVEKIHRDEYATEKKCRFLPDFLRNKILLRLMLVVYSSVHGDADGIDVDEYEHMHSRPIPRACRVLLSPLRPLEPVYPS